MKIERDGKEYVKCELCQKFATFDNSVKLGWDWFTGTLSRTHHFCHQHKTHRVARELLVASGAK